MCFVCVCWLVGCIAWLACMHVQCAHAVICLTSWAGSVQGLNARCACLSVCVCRVRYAAEHTATSDTLSLCSVHPLTPSENIACLTLQGWTAMLTHCECGMAL